MLLWKDPVTTSAPPEGAPEDAPETAPARPRLRRDLRPRTAPVAPPASNPTKPARPTSATPPARRATAGKKRPWAKTKAIGATFAIGALVTGVAIPALSAGADPVSAQAVSPLAAAEDDAQSYSADDEIRATIAPRGNFGATTPEEIEETRSQAVAAALSAGMPFASAIDIPIADGVVMPMAAGSYSFTSAFGDARPGRTHLGQDFAASTGTPIRAAMTGCVSRSTESYQGYGVTIQIESILDGQAVSTVYSHLNYGTRAVEVGDCVEEGQYLGDVGSTGYVFGSCLHFEVHVGGVAIDPRPWLQQHVG
ncbi:peptidoglycan DD-metalloendopeptidase family protein [Microbacterium sp.]|uniref:peptidoglycan DD-metalloendopeptidase family protein n=1 Tax=Microbacterium sp. TaxID=51671 RepID=UPI0026287C19|nr:peptidoglycan DD-metalloendopeptidase family protein [Microbacterium sp.]